MDARSGWGRLSGQAGAGQGKHIVFLAGDEEYRSEEGLPMLAKILAVRHGFKCTVLFAINPADGTIDPLTLTNMPGLAALDSADLCVMGLRFRELPDAADEALRGLPQRGQADHRLAHQHARVQVRPQQGKPLREIRLAQHRIGPAASASRCSARRGSITTAATATRARAGWSTRRSRTIRCCGA